MSTMQVIQHPTLSAIIMKRYRDIEEFDSEIDKEQWDIRMGVKSWVIINDSGIMAIHTRGDTINVWFVGVKRDKRRKGIFRSMIRALLKIISLWTKITMTTRPNKFDTMFHIMSRFATRCDEEEDHKSGKARFQISGWKLWIAYHSNVLKKIWIILPIILLVFYLIR